MYICIILRPLIRRFGSSGGVRGLLFFSIFASLCHGVALAATPLRRRADLRFPPVQRGGFRSPVRLRTLGNLPAPLGFRQEGQAGLRRPLAQEGRTPAGGRGLGVSSRQLSSLLPQWRYRFQWLLGRRLQWKPLGRALALVRPNGYPWRRVCTRYPRALKRARATEITKRPGATGIPKRAGATGNLETSRNNCNPKTSKGHLNSETRRVH